ncbi:winged helix-turn-helix transcriptional regulator, partial [Candidatus Woesearchaeota archaeon]|nr:winged helix-turn-helix transcriptional regulator [Candidatus Woesearchaeota archaeon]
MFVIKKERNEVYSLPAKHIQLEDTGCLSSELARKIVRLLVKSPMVPMDISKALKEHEQKIYYHVRNLEKSGIIQVVKRESRKGTTANYYSVVEPALVISFRNFELTNKIAQVKSESKFLEPFIRDGVLDAMIIVGSPDPHGPDKARSRDGYYGMDLALFLGTFLNYVP